MSARIGLFIICFALWLTPPVFGYGHLETYFIMDRHNLSGISSIMLMPTNLVMRSDFPKTVPKVLSRNPDQTILEAFKKTPFKVLYANNAQQPGKLKDLKVRYDGLLVPSVFINYLEYSEKISNLNAKVNSYNPYSGTSISIIYSVDKPETDDRWGLFRSVIRFDKTHRQVNFHVHQSESPVKKLSVTCVLDFYTLDRNGNVSRLTTISKSITLKEDIISRKTFPDKKFKDRILNIVDLTMNDMICSMGRTEKFYLHFLAPRFLSEKFDGARYFYEKYGTDIIKKIYPLNMYDIPEQMDRTKRNRSITIENYKEYLRKDRDKLLDFASAEYWNQDLEKAKAILFFMLKEGIVEDQLDRNMTNPRPCKSQVAKDIGILSYLIDNAYWVKKKIKEIDRIAKKAHLD